jgi:hypothetical protein
MIFGRRELPEAIGGGGEGGRSIGLNLDLVGNGDSSLWETNAGGLICEEGVLLIAVDSVFVGNDDEGAMESEWRRDRRDLSERRCFRLLDSSGSSASFPVRSSV